MRRDEGKAANVLESRQRAVDPHEEPVVLLNSLRNILRPPSHTATNVTSDMASPYGMCAMRTLAVEFS